MSITKAAGKMEITSKLTQDNKLINLCLSLSEDLNHYFGFLLKNRHLQLYKTSNRKDRKV